MKTQTKLRKKTLTLIEKAIVQIVGFKEFFQAFEDKILVLGGEMFIVKINLSRWLCPDKRRGLLPVQKLADGDAKTMTRARRTTAPLTLSRKQDWSRCKKFKKRVVI